MNSVIFSSQIRWCKKILFKETPEVLKQSDKS